MLNLLLDFPITPLPLCPNARGKNQVDCLHIRKESKISNSWSGGTCCNSKGFPCSVHYHPLLDKQDIVLVCSGTFRMVFYWSMIPCLASSYSFPLHFLTKINLRERTKQFYTLRKSRNSGLCISEIPYSSDSFKGQQIKYMKTKIIIIITNVSME